MRILEVIHLRMGGDDPQDLADLARAVAAEDSGDVEVRVYRHPSVEGDLLIHLHHDGGAQMSPLGIRLASILRSCGLVDHSVWVGQAGPEDGSA